MEKLNQTDKHDPYVHTGQPNPEQTNPDQTKRSQTNPEQNNPGQSNPQNVQQFPPKKDVQNKEHDKQQKTGTR